MRKLILSSITLVILWILSLSLSAYAFNDFTLPFLMDPSKEISLSEFKGKAILLNFWTFRCPYCRLELPVLSEVQKVYPRRLRVVSILFAHYSDLNAAKGWILDKGLNNIIILYDEKGKVFSSYNVLAVPHTIVFDRQGRKLVEFRGAVPKEVILSAVRKALSQ